MASELHLAGPSERDIVVVASGPLRGANVTTFWILRPLKQGYELLSTAVVHDLLIKHTRSNGYKEIEILSATAVTVSIVSLRFDGKRYETHARKSRSIR